MAVRAEASLVWCGHMSHKISYVTFRLTCTDILSTSHCYPEQTLLERLSAQATAPDSARAAAAQARSQAESMAAALEQADLEEAATQGQRAIESLGRAERLGQQAPEGSSDREIEGAARTARERLSRELRKAQRALGKLRKDASEQAKGQLEQSAQRERELAERAREIRQRSATSEAPLPGELLERLAEAAETMERAARRLEAADGHEGLARQREAQRLLEMSQPETERDPVHEGEPGEGGDFAKDATVPKDTGDDSADAFRKRVTEGLGRKPPPHLREAVRRYTEGLLR